MLSYLRTPLRRACVVAVTCSAPLVRPLHATASCDAAVATVSHSPLPPPISSVVLYQYDTCPFCNKVRAFLDLTSTPYVIVEVNPLTKKEIAWSKSYSKVPLAIINGRAVADSSLIIDAVASARGTPPPDARCTARRAWVDDVLVKHLTINIYRNWKEALSTFDYLTARNFPAWSAAAAKYVGAVAMVLVARKRRAALIPDGGDERVALVAVLDEFVGSLGAAPFSGGSTPDAADASVFGVLRAIAGLPTHEHALTQSSIGPWYRRMEAAVGPSALAHRVGEAPEGGVVPPLK